MTDGMIRKAAILAGASTAAQKGMNYFAIDGCWMSSEGQVSSELPGIREINPDEAVFPSGIESIAKVVGKEGLLFGLGVSISSEKCPELEPSSLE